MASDLRHADLPRLMRDAEAIASTARQEFGSLTPEQWNWKPDAREWSIGQCFDHLIISTVTYFPTLRAIQTGMKRPTIWERVPLLPSLFGPMLLYLLDPEAGRKVKAPAALHPSESAIDPDVLQRFDDAQRQLVGFMAATPPEALTTNVTSPVSRVITYSLMNAYRILVVHDRLHVRQARAVAASPAFPRPVTTR
jgi:hypothetical protein